MLIGRREFTIDHPIVMGILNVTPDSFSDGGKFVSAEEAVRHASKMIDEGADIIDVGGESTRPGAQGVSADEELSRVIAVIAGIRERSDIPISIDTTKAIVAERALEAGADMVNDVSAGSLDPRILDVTSKAGALLCLMHMRGTPRTMQQDTRYGDLIGEISASLSQAVRRAEDAGVDPGRIIVDPGIGFGKSASDNVVILQRLDELATLGKPILIGTSKKSFIGNLLDLEVEKRLEATMATLAIAYEKGAAIFRVHDVSPARRFLDMYALCRNPQEPHKA